MRVDRGSASFAYQIVRRGDGEPIVEVDRRGVFLLVQAVEAVPGIPDHPDLDARIGTLITHGCAEEIRTALNLLKVGTPNERVAIADPIVLDELLQSVERAAKWTSTDGKAEAQRVIDLVLEFLHG